MLFQSLNKIKQSSVVISMILMALGLVMIICPAQYTSSLIDALGFCLLILSLVMIMDYMISKKVLFNVVKLTMAIVLGLVGLAVLVFDESILKILGWVFGVVLVIQGIEHFYNAVMYVKPSGRKGWWFLAIMSVLLFAAGILIFLNPWWDTPRALLKVIGVILLFNAAVDMIRLIWIWPIKGE